MVVAAGGALANVKVANLDPPSCCTLVRAGAPVPVIVKSPISNAPGGPHTLVAELNTGCAKSIKTFVEVDFHFRFEAANVGATANASCKGSKTPNGTPSDQTSMDILVNIATKWRVVEKLLDSNNIFLHRYTRM
jgi:hypothetical protein